MPTKLARITRHRVKSQASLLPDYGFVDRKPLLAVYIMKF